MEKDYDKINTLIARFFEGYTTNEEEKELYDLFSREELPQELASYKPMFDYFETGIADDFLKENRPAAPQPKRSLKRRLWIAGSVAALLLLLVTIGVNLFPPDRPFNPYEGSYIIRNGQRIDDLNVIAPELEMVATAALLQQEKMEQLLHRAEEAERGNLRHQEMQHQLCEMVSRYENRYVREEAKRILNIHCNN